VPRRKSPLLKAMKAATEKRSCMRCANISTRDGELQAQLRSSRPRSQRRAHQNKPRASRRDIPESLNGSGNQLKAATAIGERARDI